MQTFAALEGVGTLAGPVLAGLLLSALSPAAALGSLSVIFAVGALASASVRTAYQVPTTYRPAGPAGCRPRVCRAVEATAARHVRRLHGPEPDARAADRLRARRCASPPGRGSGAGRRPLRHDGCRRAGRRCRGDASPATRRRRSSGHRGRGAVGVAHRGARTVAGRLGGVGRTRGRRSRQRHRGRLRVHRAGSSAAQPRRQPVPTRPSGPWQPGWPPCGSLAGPPLVTAVGLGPTMAVTGAALAGIRAADAPAPRAGRRPGRGCARAPRPRPATPEFAPLPAMALERLASASIPRSVLAGEAVVREGDEPDGFGHRRDGFARCGPGGRRQCVGWVPATPSGRSAC